MRKSFSKTSFLFTPLLKLRNRHFFLLDSFFLLISPLLAMLLRLDSPRTVLTNYGGPLAAYTLICLFLRQIIFYRHGLYRRYWRYASVDELGQIVAAVLLATAIITAALFAVILAVPGEGYVLPRSLALIDGLLVLVLVGGSRFSVRLVHGWRQARPGQNAQRVIVMGAGDAGTMIVRELKGNPQLGLDVVAYLDDDAGKKGVQIMGVPVLGGRELIGEVADAYNVSQVIIAMPTAPGKTIREIVQQCEQAGVSTRTIPGMYELLDGTVSVNQLRNVDIEDLLRRDAVHTDTAAVQQLLQGKQVLVTGAGGSIGSELCRQILRCHPAGLVLLGHGENSIFTIYHELRQQLARSEGVAPRLIPVIADTRDAQRIDTIFRQHRPEIVFHAAAHKHVPMMEMNPTEAVTNNVLGTQNVLQAAQDVGVARFVMISTDKAVNPTSVMGVTKRTAELLVHEAAVRSCRPYATVRFGNVLGSRGSVVLTFKEQIARGGPVTVTDPEMTRFFMTIPEAVQLVLQASELGKGGEVFVLDMGRPVKIMDLARDLIELSGLELGRDIDIVVTGKRPGEKLFEELFIPGESYERTAHEKIFVAENASKLVPAGLQQTIDALCAAALRDDQQAIIRSFQQLVPEYTPSLGDGGHLAATATAPVRNPQARPNEAYA